MARERERQDENHIIRADNATSFLGQEMRQVIIIFIIKLGHQQVYSYTQPMDHK